MGKKPPKNPRKRLPVIGWREWVGLPELGIDAVKAKVDTGARSSALHAFDVKVFERDSLWLVRFKVHPLQRDSRRMVALVAELFDERQVRNPGGRLELRPVIQTAVELMGQRWPIELTLTNRDAMGFRMLLGRRAVRGKFAIDSGRSFLGDKTEQSDPSSAA